MNQCKQLGCTLAGFLLSLAFTLTIRADTTLSTFEDFILDGVFASWVSADIASGPTEFSVSASGFGSGYKQLTPEVDATGETAIELTMTLAADGAVTGPISGPIVSLVDADGTFLSYAWYGQLKGSHVLTARLSSPTLTEDPGTTPGLNLAELKFFHLQDDPGGFHGQYTITFERLRLVGAPPLGITSYAFDPSAALFSLTWISRPGFSYTILHESDLNGSFQPLLTDIVSGGSSTTATVTVPSERAGFFRILQQ